MRFGAFSLSQWIWGIFIALIVEAISNIRKTDSFSLYPRQGINPKWDNTTNPFVFTHDSDVHINSYTSGSRDAFARILELVKQYDPEFHLITGDLSDDFSGLTWPKYADQDEIAWRGYRDTINSIKDRKYQIIDMPGNHDMWGVSFIDSERFYLLDYSQTFTRNTTQTLSSFWVRVIQTEHHPIIILKPFNFPAAHCCFLYWAEPSQYLLDLIEETIWANPHCIVTSHFPPDMWRQRKSSYGHTIREIVSHENVDYILTGHSHPSHPVYRHHGDGVLEVIGVGGMNHSRFGLVTEDNGRIVYHEIDAKSPQKFFVTHPVPITQTNTRLDFSDYTGTEIRVLSTESNATIHVNGKEMTFQRRISENGLYLYSSPLTVTVEGENTLIFSGDYNGNITFHYKRTAKYQEKEIESPHPSEVTYRALPFIVLLTIYVFFPFNVFDWKFLERWIQQEDEQENNNGTIGNNNSNESILSCHANENNPNFVQTNIQYTNHQQGFDYRNIPNIPTFLTSNKSFFGLLFGCIFDTLVDLFNDLRYHFLTTIFYYAMAIGAGFYAVRTRFLRLPFVIRLIFFIGAIWPAIFPTTVMEIDGKAAYIDSYGYKIWGQSHVFASDGPDYSYSYVMKVFIPLAVLASGLSTLIKPGAKNPYNFFCAIDLIYPIISLSKDIPYLITHPLSESAGLHYMKLSIVFVFIPSFLVFTTAVYLVWILYKHFSHRENVRNDAPVPYESIGHGYVIA
ncbi:hypothetical protein TRFO_16131 [Tritrichomonas foetus]|uniref:Calcineurin-like phosphoesterase domain-containing protein n=1 Tax=Tritrichomonas foetus TaxID=1144522 RepID=A0A1J4KW11_9EUKA|nr:hypothetical protein TRFO_16131 [Tritrichomonas foetus]|eukprot:OHT13693.1 hypothetical protein TRFO_16131 [Tritrichomonas foetus]